MKNKQKQERSKMISKKQKLEYVKKLVKAIRHCDTRMEKITFGDGEDPIEDYVAYRSVDAFKDGVLFAVRAILGRREEIKILEKSLKKKRSE